MLIIIYKLLKGLYCLFKGGPIVVR